MKTMTISRPVKYNKKRIAPNEKFDVQEEHVEHLRKLGAHIVGEVEKVVAPVEPDGEEEEIEEDGEEALPVSHDALVARAEELGIEVGKKGDNTLMKLIRKTENELEE